MKDELPLSQVLLKLVIKDDTLLAGDLSHVTAGGNGLPQRNTCSATSVWGLPAERDPGL